MLDWARRGQRPTGHDALFDGALVVETASSMRCFFSFSSTRCGTDLDHGDTPDSLARRSWSFSRS